MEKELIAFNLRLDYMEKSLGRMEQAVTTGMDKISSAMEGMAVVMAKMTENTEDHKTIHARIDKVHDSVEELKDDSSKSFEEVKVNVAEVKIICETCKAPEKPTPVRTALIITGVTALLGSFVLLLMMHGDDVIKFLFR